ncbi:Leucine-zipper-like transcriptional regulator 1 [Kalmusia sp. IMI 367209]|nr:Leucine-zipper-like transcriptional regulator 1 [Kalmusia sp. IMI 367209]
MRSLLPSFLFLLSIPSPVISETWIPLAKIPLAPRQEHATVFLPPDNIIIVGGITNGTQSTTNIIQSYSTRKNKWTSLPPLPIALNHPNAAVVNEELYVLGGLAQTTDAWVAIADSWVYNPRKQSWTPIAPVPEARGSAAIQFTSPYAQDTVSTVSIYSPKTNTWLSVPDAASHLPDTRDHACSAVVNQKFYVLGGREKGQINGKGSVLVLDLENLENGWVVSSAVMPTPRAGLACGTVSGKVYTFGGEGNLNVENGVFNVTEVYDTKTNSWLKLGQMKLPRHGGGAVAVNGRVYVPGGGDVIGMAPVTYFDVLLP